MASAARLTVSTTGKFAHEQANRLLTELSAHIARTIQSPGADEVHDFRVSIRKFRCVLTVLEPCFPGKEVKTISRRLKRIMTLAGKVRDRDIALEFLEASPLMEAFRKAREDAADALTDSLRGWVEQKTGAKWRSGLKGEAGDGEYCARPVTDTVESILGPMVKEHFHHGEDAARAGSRVKELHKFRIATKKLRYTLDLFAPLYKGTAEEFAEELKDMQTLLGDSNDCAVVRRMVPREFGDVRNGLKKKQHRKAEKFRKLWRERKDSGDIKNGFHI